MTIACIRTGSPANLDTLHVATCADPGQPGPGEIRVRLQASSLNYHDFAVAAGMIPAAAGRIPMSDGAGVVEAVGDGVSEFSAGQLVAVKTDGSGDAPVQGTLARLDPTGITVIRKGSRCGTVAVHFPRLGQMVVAV